jgi:hypothetical protein
MSISANSKAQRWDYGQIACTCWIVVKSLPILSGTNLLSLYAFQAYLESCSTFSWYGASMYLVYLGAENLFQFVTVVWACQKKHWKEKLSYGWAKAIGNLG